MKPTKQEYETALNANKILKMIIAENQEDTDKFLDSILSMRKLTQECEKNIERNNELIMKYEFYEEYESKVK